MSPKIRSSYDEAAWRSLIQSTLADWLENPPEADEGFDPPSPQILHLAMRVAERLRAEGHPQPLSIVRDPNGGIVFERRLGDEVWTVHLWDDGSIEQVRFRGSKVVEREPIFADLTPV